MFLNKSLLILTTCIILIAISMQQHNLLLKIYNSFDFEFFRFKYVMYQKQIRNLVE